MPSCGNGRLVGAPVVFPLTEMVWDDGWLDVCTVAVAAAAFGSCSKLNKDPKLKCWTTGNLESTSALYILIMPWRFVRTN